MSVTSEKYNFNKIDDVSLLDILKATWRNTLTAPQDGMWAVFREYATPWEIRKEDQRIGYACVDDENRLLQFFLLPQWMSEGLPVFHQFIQENDINQALIGTTNPFCLSIAMHFQKAIKVHTYLFTHLLEVKIVEREGTLSLAHAEDLKSLVDFCHKSMGGPKEWLNGYLGNLIGRGELFMLKKEEEILGTCEVRKSDINSAVADVGMIVSSEHRKKGLGTFLLGNAIKIAKQWGRQSICSCEKDNLGSLKAIQANGFRSLHQLLLMDF